MKIVQKYRQLTLIDKLIFIAALVGATLFATSHRHTHSGSDVAPVPAHNCVSVTSFIPRVYASDDAPNQADTRISSNPAPAPIAGHGVVRMDIIDQGFSPTNVTAHLCDTLVITNAGSQPHQPAVGPHPYHTAYPGLEALRPMLPGESFVFILNRPGSYPLHDHLAETHTGYISVRE